MYNEIMCDFGNIYKAYKLAHRGKINAAEVIEFDKNKIYNLQRLKKKLLAKDWNGIFKYYNFTIREPKERSVDALTFEGRIVQHILCDQILRPWFEKRLVKENCACRQNKGTHYAMNLLKQAMIKYRDRGNCYILKMDVKKYFPSIDREILKRLLKDFPDEEIKELLFYIIDTSPNTNGIPIGNQSSQWFALYYLDAVDRIIKEQSSAAAYARYMDDLVIICPDKQTATDLLSRLRGFVLSERKMIFNSKTQIYPLSRGVTFLGWRYLPFRQRIIMRIESGKRFFRVRKIEEILSNYKTGRSKFGDFLNSIISVRANLNFGNTYAFQQKFGVLNARGSSLSAA